MLIDYEECVICKSKDVRVLYAQNESPIAEANGQYCQACDDAGNYVEDER